MPTIVDKSEIIKVCIDDFALRKRFSYGTVMVNIDNHQIIDMIPSRDTADVRKWLASYPNIKIISRDGAITYSSSSKTALPYAIQISDRFHLIKGLSEAATKYIIRKFPARIEIPLTENVTEEMKALYNISNRSLRIKYAHQKRDEGLTISEIALLLHSSNKTINKYLATPIESIDETRYIAREKQHQLAIQQKQQDVNEVRKLSKEGYPVEQIAMMLHHTNKTIQNYLDPSYSIVDGHYNNRIPGKLSPYEKDVIELRSQGMAYPKILIILQEKGYTGSCASLRMFMQKERTRRHEQRECSKSKSEFIQRRSLCQAIYKKIEYITTLSKKQYNATIEKYPELAQLYLLIKEFHSIVFSKKADKLESWINAARLHNIPELQTFIEGVMRDIEAVKNGISYDYNNGLAEGSVNKIKVIKRIMYGRNSFELLKAKVLLYELFQCEIN